MWVTIISDVVLGYSATDYITDTFIFERVLPGFLKWRKTSKKELEDVDKQILDSIPCVKERQFVNIGTDDRIWTITCSPEKTGTPVVMVHGMGGGVGLWALNLDTISERRPIYAFDLLGFGRSSRPSYSDDAEQAEQQFVDSIEEWRKKMNLDKFILLGHSLGGFLCASYAIRYPERVKHLILADPWGMNQKPPEGLNIPWYVRSIVNVVTCVSPLSILRLAGPWGPSLVKRYRPGLAETFGEKLEDNSVLHNYVYHCNAQKPSGEVGFKSMTENLGWAKRPMSTRLISDLDNSVPITFIYGSESWVKRSIGWEVRNEREKSYVDVQVIRGAGHHVYADRANLFNTLVTTIADSVDKGELPRLDKKLTQRIHSTPTVPNFHPPRPDDPDIQRPGGYPEEDIE